MGASQIKGIKQMTNLKAMQSAISALDSGHWGHGIPEAYAILYEAIEQAKTQLPQREWVGLTTKQAISCYSIEPGKFSKAIEAKLKELNT